MDIANRKGWTFLDHVDLNLLYIYADVMSGKNKAMHLDERQNEIDEDTKMGSRDMYRRQNAYYLFWFVYRYLLGCETLEDTIPYQNKETLKKYRLLSFIQNNENLFVGIPKKVVFRKPEDIGMILEILYNRYTPDEQIDCFIAGTKNAPKRREACKRMKAEIEEIKRRLELKEEDA